MEYQFTISGYNPILLRDLTLLKMGLVYKIFKNKNIIDAIQNKFQINLNQFLIDPAAINNDNFTKLLDFLEKRKSIYYPRFFPTNNAENLSLFLPVITFMQQTVYYKDILCIDDEQSILTTIQEALSIFLISLRKKRILSHSAPSLSLLCFAQHVINLDLICEQFDKMMENCTWILPQHIPSLINSTMNIRRRPVDLFIKDATFTYADRSLSAPSNPSTNFSRDFYSSYMSYRSFRTTPATHTEISTEIRALMHQLDRT